MPVRRAVSTTSVTLERFGDGSGSSGWKWEKGGVGMGGKDAGKLKNYYIYS